MSLLVIFLSIVLFLDCILLVFLVLLQLPKKDAGAGMAFGAAATDALFGAGSGNVLTKITKYVAGVFFALALILAILNSHQTKQTAGGALLEELKKGSPAASIPQAPADTSPSAPSSKPSSSGSMLLTNLPSTPAPSAAPASTNN
jgi:preprotein translocase subunit SecG